MAATITASMAGDLLKKGSPPLSQNKEMDDKFKSLKDQLSSFKKIFSPKAVATEQDSLIEKFKKDVGFEEFPIKDQKAMIQEINEHTETSYDTLVSIEDNLNSMSSLLYKNITKVMDLTITKSMKGFQLKKSIVEQLSESLKMKIQNIAPIKSLSNAFSSIRSMINKGFASVSKGMSGFFSSIGRSISAFGAKLSAFNPFAMLKDYFSKMFKPVLDAIDYIGQ